MLCKKITDPEIAEFNSVTLRTLQNWKKQDKKQNLYKSARIGTYLLYKNKLDFLYKNIFKAEKFIEAINLDSNFIEDINKNKKFLKQIQIEMKQIKEIITDLDELSIV